MWKIVIWRWGIVRGAHKSIHRVLRTGTESIEEFWIYSDAPVFLHVSDNWRAIPYNQQRYIYNHLKYVSMGTIYNIIQNTYSGAEHFVFSALLVLGESKKALGSAGLSECPSHGKTARPSLIIIIIFVLYYCKKFCNVKTCVHDWN